MKRSIAVAVAAIAMASASPAFAVDFILSNLGGGGPTEDNFKITSQGSTFVSASLGRNVGSGPFSDRFIFAPTFFGVGSGQAAANQFANLNFTGDGIRIDAYSFAGAALGGFANIGANLTTGFLAGDGDVAAYNAAVAYLADFLDPLPASAAVYSQVGVNSDTAFVTGRALGSVPLDTNNFYVITITGTGGGQGSLYDGNLSATSVPEPATWAMMLAGFGVIGFGMRRQRKAHPKVRFAF